MRACVCVCCICAFRCVAYAYVCTCIWYMHPCMCAEAWGRHQVSSFVTLYLVPLTWGLLLNLEHHLSARMAFSKPRDPSISAFHWDYRSSWSGLAFSWVLGLWTCVLVVVQKMLYPWAISPAPAVHSSPLPNALELSRSCIHLTESHFSCRPRLWELWLCVLGDKGSFS